MCAILSNDKLKCVGNNGFGQFGYEKDENIIIGNQQNEMGDHLAYVTDFTVKSVAVGSSFICTLNVNNQVICFGDNSFGQLGTGNTDHRNWGAQPVDFGTSRYAIQIGCGWFHCCAILDNNDVACWGYGPLLGLEQISNVGLDTDTIGNNFVMTNLGNTGVPTKLGAGPYHTCVLFEDYKLKCWGSNSSGQLGLETSGMTGDEDGEMGDMLE